MQIFAPSHHTIQKIYRSFTISERAGSFFVDNYTAGIEEILEKKYGFNKRERSVYAKSVVNATLRSIRYGRWSPDLIEKHIADQILVRELIDGKSYEEHKARLCQAGSAILKKLYPGETSGLYNDVVQESWDALEMIVLKKEFVLKSTILHFFSRIIRNTYYNKKRKNILLEKFQRITRKNTSEKEAFNSSSGFLRDQETGFEQYSMLDHLYDRLDAVVLKEINLLASKNCRDFLQLRYGISGGILAIANELEYYTSEELRDIFEVAYSEGFKGKTIKEAAEILGIERKRQNILAQRCLDRLVIRVLPAIEKIIKSGLYKGPDVDSLSASIENRGKVAIERQEKRYADNKRYR